MRAVSPPDEPHPRGMVISLSNRRPSSAAPGQPLRAERRTPGAEARPPLPRALRAGVGEGIALVAAAILTSPHEIVIILLLCVSAVKTGRRPARRGRASSGFHRAP